MKEVGVFRNFRYRESLRKVKITDWCKELDITRSALYRFEQSEIPIPYKVIVKMAGIMGVSVSEVVDDEGYMIMIEPNIVTRKVVG